MWEIFPGSRVLSGRSRKMFFAGRICRHGIPRNEVCGECYSYWTWKKKERRREMEKAQKDRNPDERVGWLDLPAEWIRWGHEQTGDKGSYWAGYCPLFGTGVTFFSSIPPTDLEREHRMVRASIRVGKFHSPKVSAFAQKNPTEKKGGGGDGGLPF